MGSSSGSRIPRYDHDVFLSFRGIDTRTSFAYNLYKALETENIKTYFDDHKLKKGDHIAATLQKAIEASKISVVIFSENYAGSSWCLNELVKILECEQSEREQIVIPVFYKVEPTDVRYQKGPFGKAFADFLTHKSYKQEEVNPKWKKALTEVANFSGWTYEKGYEYVFIDDIVKGVKVNIDWSSPKVEKNLGGMELYNSAFLEDQRKTNGVGAKPALGVGQNSPPPRPPPSSRYDRPAETGVYSQEFRNNVINKWELMTGGTPPKPSPLTKTSTISANKSCNRKNNSSFAGDKCDPGEENRAVLYTTSVQGVRKTFTECNEARSALKRFGMAVCERDLSMDGRYLKELRRFWNGEVRLPTLVFDGLLVGGYDEVMRFVRDGFLEV